VCPTAVDDSSRTAAAVRSVTLGGAVDGPAGPLPAMDPAASELRALALSALPQMFDHEVGLFSFGVRRRGRSLIRQGVSRRYTAITLIGLAGEPDHLARGILGGRSVREVADQLVRDAGAHDSIGDLALIAWAAKLAGSATASLWSQITARRPAELSYPTVEVAWALSAAVADNTALTAPLRDALAVRVRGAMSPHGLFPHQLPASARMNSQRAKARRAEAPEAQRRQVRLKADTTYGRSHVACFADLAYPVLALAQHGDLTGDPSSTATAIAAAQAMCRLQGDEGQWWWHYDYRTGRVLERYPVYAVHQDSMAPMALFAAARAARLDFGAAIAKGVRWLWHAPELNGGSLIDRSSGIIWRKVARREPRKLSRYIQAGVSRLSAGFRAPGLDVLFPPRAIDYEDRPYHLGWVLYAWPEKPRAVGQAVSNPPRGRA
jgi:hypothetical protein